MLGPRGGKVVTFRPLPEPAVRLLCFHHAGASAQTYARWPDLLPPDVELCAIQLPGHGGRSDETLHYSIEPLVDDLIDALAECLDRPFVVFGHSMGTLVAFESIRRLRREGLPLPRHLIASGCPAPHLGANTSLSELGEDQFAAECRRLGLIPAGLARSGLLRLLLPALRADLSVCEGYRYRQESRLRCPITVLGGTEDGLATHDQLAGWDRHTTATTRLHLFPGGHDYPVTMTTNVLSQVRAALT